MDTLRTPAALASLIAANLAPLVGVVLLGWSPLSILVLYFVDTLFALGVVMLLVMMHITGNEHGGPLSGWKDWAKALLGLAILGSIFAFPMSLPLWIVGGDELAVEFERPGNGLLYGIAAQAAMSAFAAVRMHRVLKLREDDDRILARRALFLVARWMTMFIAMVTGFVALLGPAIGGFVLIAIYGGASIYFELFPERAERFVRGPNAKPITYHADLDGPGISAPPRTAADAPIPPVAPAKPPLAQPMKSHRRKRRR
jgi:Family of unknown function (DUF6498)